ncbi:MAG: cupin domain-containing protein [Ignavibacteria bacterium]|nr:cupin domain-containing protein [Ignavibacteria bacterium]
MAYRIQKNPFPIPTTDGKLIEEFFGKASINAGDYSIARMTAPPGWSEPHQTPEFDEVTYIIRGKKQFEIEGEVITLGKNESILVAKGTRVRYSNPFAEPVEYISFCMPAFSADKVHRENIT